MSDDKMRDAFESEFEWTNHQSDRVPLCATSWGDDGSTGFKVHCWDEDVFLWEGRWEGFKAAWKAAQRQGDYWKGWEEGFESARTEAFAPQPAVPETDWIACSERLPTEEDADINGHVWLYSTVAGCMLMSWSKCKYHVSLLDELACYWKPTGLKRPEPPEDV